MLPRMTTTSDPDRIAQVLRVYRDDPVPDGDMVLLLLDEQVCWHVDGLADHWDDEQTESVVQVLTETTSTVLVAVARPQAQLLDSDFALWRDLHAGLRDSPVRLLPLRALPAA